MVITNRRHPDCCGDASVVMWCCYDDDDDELMMMMVMTMTVASGEEKHFWFRPERSSEKFSVGGDMVAGGDWTEGRGGRNLERERAFENQDGNKPRQPKTIYNTTTARHLEGAAVVITNRRHPDCCGDASVVMWCCYDDDDDELMMMMVMTAETAGCRGCGGYPNTEERRGGKLARGEVEWGYDDRNRSVKRREALLVQVRDSGTLAENFSGGSAT
ncbi:hypothetical protein Tco_0807864 [Tanacetum coccineum]